MPTVQEYLALRNGTDVRGVAVFGVENEPVTLTREIVKQIANSFCFWLAAKTGKSELCIAVGYDSRISAPALSSAFLEGVTELGNDAVATGLSTTPSMFMLLKDENRKAKKEIDGSVMITASHLPFNRNGLKFFTPDGGLEGSEVKEILTLAGEREFPVRAKKGNILFAPYLDEYAASLVALVRKETGEEQPLKQKKILVDAGNGAGGFYVEKVLKPLGADTTGSQFLDPDGTFPTISPTPRTQKLCAPFARRSKRTAPISGLSSTPTWTERAPSIKAGKRSTATV